MGHADHYAAPPQAGTLVTTSTGWLLLGLALVSFAVAAWFEAYGLGYYFLLAGVSLSSVFVTWLGYGLLRRSILRRELRAAAQLIGLDDAPGFVSDHDGRLSGLNAAARERFKIDENALKTGLAGADDFGGILRDVFAKPRFVLGRLQAEAAEKGNAVEEVVTQSGHLKLNVFRLPRAGFVWRLDEIGAGPARHKSETGLPMVTVGRGNVILFMNDAARAFCGNRPRSLESIFPDLPLRSGGFTLGLSQGGRRNCLVHEVEQSLGRREVYFLPISAADEADHTPLGDAALDKLPVAVLRITPKGEVLGANTSAQSLLTLGVEECPQLDNYLEGPGRPLIQWLSLGSEDGADIATEFLRVKHGEGDLFVQACLSQIEERDGRRLLLVLSDATAIKGIEAKFAQSQKMQAIGELAGGIAHDFNNLLTTISGHCDLLLRQHHQNDSDYSDLMQIRQNANRAASLVRQLLAFSRKQTLRPEILDLRDAIGDMAHLLNRLVGEKVRLELDHDPDLWALRADPRQLEQVLMNLVVNARDALGGMGEVQIDARNHNLTAPMVRDAVTIPAGDYVQIMVKDAGCGILPERLDKIFEPFYTTKRAGEGTGLGLSTVYGIVKQTGGYVFVESTVGVGTRFVIMLPAEINVVPEKPAPKIEEFGTIPFLEAEGVVLLVEDEAPVRAFAARALRLSGLTVIEAESAEEALDLLRDRSLEIDLFLSDVIMTGLDGPSWVKLALEQRPDAKVIFMSGYAEDAFQHQDLLLNQAEFLPKPFSLEALTKVVQHQLQ